MGAGSLAAYQLVTHLSLDGLSPWPVPFFTRGGEPKRLPGCAKAPIPVENLPLGTPNGYGATVDTMPPR
jgi:hypothetical protein